MKNSKIIHSLLPLAIVFFLAFGLLKISAKEIDPPPGDPLGWCPDGTIKCARTQDGTKIWHKGN